MITIAPGYSANSILINHSQGKEVYEHFFLNTSLSNPTFTPSALLLCLNQLTLSNVQEFLIASKDFEGYLRILLLANK